MDNNKRMLVLEIGQSVKIGEKTFLMASMSRKGDDIVCELKNGPTVSISQRNMPEHLAEIKKVHHRKPPRILGTVIDEAARVVTKKQPMNRR
ncbi:hypothetical protein L6270_03930 [Candidatus Parcubacteria bacterium]|nr:hypothetical protein [Patescibacteria group bacterium]MBU4309113.1 hypothetical protein [Patescibacteria group bacterium]MBU4432709.1 hypothetical protein [Patescibacteria group bacterium]MBU4577474.1 hypothetical protein [Patescibacteria group bacterium]MCG2697162.1 hypothetical protein [Candidatus Parcubacteria bacterium]